MIYNLWNCYTDFWLRPRHRACLLQ